MLRYVMLHSFDTDLFGVELFNDILFDVAVC